MVWNLPTLIATASAIAGWIALILSVVNVRTSRRALRLSERQEERRKPSLKVYLQEGFTSFGSSSRVYAVLLLVSNVSDSDNSIAGADLHLTYSSSDGETVTVKFEARTEPPPALHRVQTSLLIPTRIDAHQVISGWYFFSVDNAILNHAKVERTVVVLRDAHGNENSIEPLILREYSYENMADGKQEELSKAE